MGVASWSFVVWAAVWVWAGRGCSSRKAGWLVLWFPACVVGAGVVGLSGAGIGDTPALSCFCFLLVWGVGCGGCPCVCGGGMLSGFWGSAPWLPGSSGAPGCGGSWVGVGGLVVNCIVDASILL